MKFIIIPYIALGFVLSILIGVEYNCVGEEMFPIYYGSPFVFKQKSLGSSMEYYYSISGLLLNIAIWSIIISFIRIAILKLIKKRNNKVIIFFYKGFVGILILFTTLNIAIDYVMLGSGFNKNLNYWYMNLDKEAEDWGMKCEGEWAVFWQ